MFRVAALAVIVFAVPIAAAEPPRFERDVKPILAAKCLKCHGAETAKASLDLRTTAAIKQGGETGPAIVPGDATKSLLLEQITTGAMPPGKGAKLTPAEIATIKAWIEAGAPADDAGTVAGPAAPTHWAFLPPSAPRCRQCPARATRSMRSYSRSFRRRGWRSPLKRTGSPCCAASPSTSPVSRRRRPSKTRSSLTSPRTLTRKWSIGCSPRPATASAGAGTGSTWPGTPTARASSTPTTSAPPRGATATGSSGRSTPTCPTTVPARADRRRRVQRLLDALPQREGTPAGRGRVDRRDRVPAVRVGHEPARLRQHQERAGLLLPDARRHAGHRQHGDAGADGAVCEVPLAQVRPDPAGRLLPRSGRVHERVPPGSVGAAGATPACSRRPRRRRRTRPYSTRKSAKKVAGLRKQLAELRRQFADDVVRGPTRETADRHPRGRSRGARHRRGQANGGSEVPRGQVRPRPEAGRCTAPGGTRRGVPGVRDEGESARRGRRG